MWRWWDNLSYKAVADRILAYYGIYFDFLIKGYSYDMQIIHSKSKYTIEMQNDEAISY